MSERRKRESLGGVILTAALCAAFLYWWFRPEPPPWQHESPLQLVARAAAEPPPDDPAQRWVLDADFTETALLHARTGEIDAALKCLEPVRDPVMRARAHRQLALAHLNSDSDDLGRSLTLCDAIPDEAARAEARREVLSVLARLGFADVAMAQATTPDLKALLAQVMAESDGAEKARELSAELAAAIPSLPPADGARLRESLAWVTVKLALFDGPDDAIRTVAALPPERQEPLWTELFRLCFGRPENPSRDAQSVLAAIPDQRLRRRLELEALDSNIVTRLPDEILPEWEEAAANAADGPDKIRALTDLAVASRRCGRADAATEALRKARTMAAALPEPAAALLDLVDPLTDLTLLDDATACLAEAAAAIEKSPPAGRLPLLVRLADAQFDQAAADAARATAATALPMALESGADPAARRRLAAFFVRLGDWPAAFSLVAAFPPGPDRDAALTEVATLAAEDSLGYDPVAPPPRGEPVDGLRRMAAGDEARVFHLVAAQPAGYARARAWLAMAKGLLTTLPPAPADGPPPLPDEALPPEDGTPVPLPPMEDK